MRRALQASGYSSPAIAELVGHEALQALLDGWTAPAIHRLSGQGHLGTLARLFAAGVDVAASDLEDLPSAYLDDWTDAGLVRLQKGRAHPLVAIDTFGSDRGTLYLVADAPRRGSGAFHHDGFVAGLSPNVDTIFRLAPRRARGRILDAGCRSGPLALMLAAAAGEVTGTETAGRAMAFARFNLALNRVENVDLLEGDLFEPVAGESFDLVVSDRARLVSVEEPDSAPALREAVAGDLLRSGGWAVLTAQWALSEGETLEEHIGRTLRTSCAAMVLQLRSDTPAGHLAGRLRQIGRFAPEEADRLFNRFSADFEGRGVTEVVTGLTILHRVERSSPWLAVRRLPDIPAGDLTGVLPTLFQAEEWLGRHVEPGEMLRNPLRLAPSVLLQPSVRPDDNRWVEDGATWKALDGLYRAGRLSAAVAAILARCDGAVTLGQRFEEWCAAPGVRPPGWEGSREAAMKNLDAIARDMVAMGLLVVPPGG